MHPFSFQGSRRFQKVTASLQEGCRRWQQQAGLGSGTWGARPLQPQPLLPRGYGFDEVLPPAPAAEAPDTQQAIFFLETKMNLGEKSPGLDFPNPAFFYLWFCLYLSTRSQASHMTTVARGNPSPIIIISIAVIQGGSTQARHFDPVTQGSGASQASQISPCCVVMQQSLLSRVGKDEGSITFIFPSPAQGALISIPVVKWGHCNRLVTGHAQGYMDSKSTLAPVPRLIFCALNHCSIAELVQENQGQMGKCFGKHKKW